MLRYVIISRLHNIVFNIFRGIYITYIDSIWNARAANLTRVARVAGKFDNKRRRCYLTYHVKRVYTCRLAFFQDLNKTVYKLNYNYSEHIDANVIF